MCVYVYMLPAPCNVVVKFYVLSDLKKCDTSASVTHLWTVKHVVTTQKSVFSYTLESNDY